MATNTTESPYIFPYKTNNISIFEQRWEIPVFPNWYTNCVTHMHQITLLNTYLLILQTISHDILDLETPLSTDGLKLSTILHQDGDTHTHLQVCEKKLSTAERKSARAHAHACACIYIYIYIYIYMCVCV